jgi:hypothetical protein
MLVTVDDHHRAHPEFRPLDVFRWQRCTLPAGSMQRGEDLVQQFRTELSRVVNANDRMPMAVRVEVTGVCPAHERLLADPERWINELRSAALEVGAGSVWLEKVQMHTSPARVLDRRLLEEGPLGELISLICDLKQRDEPLLALRQELKELDDLERKLPDEVKRGEVNRDEDGVRPMDAAELRAALEEVQCLVMERLQAQEVRT